MLCLGGVFMDNNQSKKDKIQVGEICYFDRSEPKKTKSN